VREHKRRASPERLAMEAVARTFASKRRYEAAQRLAKLGRGPLARLAGAAPVLSKWTGTRDLPEIPNQTFREWWRSRQTSAPASPSRPGQDHPPGGGPAS
jgi:L-lactate dehydrogenase complex protein LldF